MNFWDFRDCFIFSSGNKRQTNLFAIHWTDQYPGHFLLAIVKRHTSQDDWTGRWKPSTRQKNKCWLSNIKEWTDRQLRDLEGVQDRSSWPPYTTIAVTHYSHLTTGHSKGGREKVIYLHHASSKAIDIHTVHQFCFYCCAHWLFCIKIETNIFTCASSVSILFHHHLLVCSILQVKW